MYAECAHGRKHFLRVRDVAKIAPFELFNTVFPPGRYCFCFFENSANAQHINKSRGAMARLAEFQQKRAALEKDDSEAFICDVDHHCGSKGQSLGKIWPTLLTHGTVMMLKDALGHCKMATGLEHFSAQGFSMFPLAESKVPRCPLFNILRSLSARQQKLLAGNTMLLCVQAGWMLYILSNTVRRPSDEVGRVLPAPEGDEPDNDCE